MRWDERADAVEVYRRWQQRAAETGDTPAV